MPIIPDMAFADYLAHPAYGSSDLKTFRAGPPAMVPWRRANRHEGTQSTRLGTAAHCLILTPDLFALTYAVRPEGMDYRSKAGKEWRDDQLAEGFDILTGEELVTVQGVRDAFRAKTAARESFNDAIGVEASMFWSCMDMLPLKGRPDWYDAESVYDLKVSILADRDPEGMRWGIMRMGWFHQLAHNRQGLVANNVRGVKFGRLVMVSPKPPHTVRLVHVADHDLDLLDLHNEATREEMAVCHARNEWPGTPDTWTAIELPASAAFTETDLEGTEEIIE